MQRLSSSDLRHLSSQSALSSYGFFLPLALWRRVSLQTFGRPLGSCLASGIPWSRAMPPSLRRSWITTMDRRDGVVVRASASQSVDLGFIPLVESCQKDFKNGILSFPAWRSAFMGGCGQQAGKLACCVLGQGT